MNSGYHSSYLAIILLFGTNLKKFWAALRLLGQNTDKLSAFRPKYHWLRWHAFTDTLQRVRKFVQWRRVQKQCPCSVFRPNLNAALGAFYLQGLRQDFQQELQTFIRVDTFMSDPTASNCRLIINMPTLIKIFKSSMELLTVILAYWNALFFT